MTHPAPPGDEACFVYGVVLPEPPPATGLRGVAGAPVTLVTAHGVAAVVSPVAPDRVMEPRNDLMAYHAVMESLVERGPVAPVRFGTVLPDRTAVTVDFLAPQHEYFADLLASLAGHRQYALRAEYIEDAVLADLVAMDDEIRHLRDTTRSLPEDAGLGQRVRLGELVTQALEERSSYDAGILLETVAGAASRYVVRGAPGPVQVLDAALLVREDRVDDLVEQCEALAEVVHERIRMRLLGPMAPYDFVEVA